MSIQEQIAAIKQKHGAGMKIHPPATIEQIRLFEQVVGFELPLDFEDFYLFCNGFECEEDIFNFTRLEDISSEKCYGPDWFSFAEYMIYSDTWNVKVLKDGGYEILSSNSEVILTSSLQEFLMRFCNGGVFEKEGLYDWEGE